MSTAATATEAPVTAPAKGKKKLIIIIAAVLAVVLIGGGAGAYFMMKKSAAVEAAAAEGEEGAEAHAGDHAPAKGGKKDTSHAPVFVPLEPFTVNLADREAERYAQIGVTLEVDDAKVSDQIKAYMPAIRNNILMAIADRTAADLLGRDGKTKLAQRIARETSRALGFAVEDEPVEEAVAAEEESPTKKPVKKKKKAPAEPLPIRAVHFSNFIIQ
jgi:flagellar FliL protein